MNIRYMEASCLKYTFQDRIVKKEVESLAIGRVLNLFAGPTRLNIGDIIYVDSNPDMEPDVVMTAENFLKLCYRNGVVFDTIIWDPPWDERKSKEKYEGNYIGKFQKLKNLAVLCLREGGRIISMGWQATYFGRIRGMDILDLVIFDPKGEQRPFLMSTEVMVKRKNLNPVVIERRSSVRDGF